jgi:phospho-N-acetylmuramoyl-pentapeptide-transferase
MLLWLLQHIANSLSETSACAAFEKITFRAALAAAVSFTLAILLGPRWIAWLRRRYREPIVGDSAHLVAISQSKQSTPTLGGLFIIAGLIGSLVLFGDLANRYVQSAIALTVGLGIVGMVDDLIKLRGPANGLSARGKLIGQFIAASIAAAMVYSAHAKIPQGLVFQIPCTSLSWSLGAWFVPLAIVVIVASSNAVNLADGLDGLAGGCLMASVAAIGVVTYACGHAEWAAYLGLPRIPAAGELTVLIGAMMGAVLGFLWFNCHPAQVFMGDTGALPLGGLLGLLAVVSRQELLLVVIGGVFVAEALSVILQVGFYKWRHRRLFLCAPLHHHFQFLGWPENRIVVRFWIASALCALLGLATLKLQLHERQQPPSVIAASASLDRR